MLDPDDYDYSTISQACADMNGYAICVGGVGPGDIINENGK